MTARRPPPAIAVAITVVLVGYPSVDALRPTVTVAQSGYALGRNVAIGGILRSSSALQSMWYRCSEEYRGILLSIIPISSSDQIRLRRRRNMSERRGVHRSCYRRDGGSYDLQEPVLVVVLPVGVNQAGGVLHSECGVEKTGS